MSPIDDLVRLSDENRELNDQVKQLVQAERSLWLSTRRLDRHLHRIEVLNHFAVAGRHAQSPPEVLELAIDALFACFPLEQAIAIFEGSRGTFSVAAVRGVGGLEPVAPVVSDRPVLSAATAALALEAVAGIAPTCDSRVRRLDEWLSGVFSREGHYGEGVALLVLPVRFTNEPPKASIVARRVTPELSLLEELPGPMDESFLCLMAEHFASALGNIVVIRDCQEAEQRARRQSAEVERHYHEATEAIRVRDEFLSVASHELRTPITSLMLQLDLSKASAPRQIAMLESHCRRIAKLTDQLLDVSRIRAGRLELTFAEVDLATLVRQIAARFSPELARSGSTLSLELAADATVECDAGRVDQVLTNLLGNAMKFGRGRPISLRVEATADAVSLAVRDQGMGIAPSDQQRVFDRFERGVSERNFGGLGLGLYIARQIIEAHGGTIGLQSALGAGSTFTVVLPRRRAPH